MTEIKQTATWHKWERSLKDRKARAIIASRIFRLACGLPSDTKSVGGKVVELRIHYGPGYRVYFTKYRQEWILLLCGGSKGSQQRDIETAVRLAGEVHGDD